MRKLILVATVISFGVFLAGCMIAPHSYTHGRPIADNKVTMIQKGKTTKDEVINWFGVPTTIIKKGDKAKAERSSQTAAVPATVSLPPYFMSGGASGSPTEEVSSEQLFSLFSTKNKIKDDDVIYYYAYTTTRGASFGLLFFNSNDSHSVTDKLLILVNEQKGVVEDFIMSKGS